MMRRCAILLCVATAVASLHDNVDNCRPVPSYVERAVEIPLPVPVFFDMKKAEKPKQCSSGVQANQCKKATFLRKCGMTCAIDAIKKKKAPMSMELYEQAQDKKYVNAAKKAGFLRGDWLASSFQMYKMQHEFVTQSGSSEYVTMPSYNSASSYESNFGYAQGYASAQGYAYVQPPSPDGSQEYADCDYPYEVFVDVPQYKPFYVIANVRDTDKKMCKKQATEPVCREPMSDVALACGRSCFKFLRDVEFYKLAGFCSVKKKQVKCNKPADEQKLVDAFLGMPMYSAPAAQCQDRDDNCEPWAEDGQCQKNQGWMSQNCPKSCSLCV